MVHESLRDEKRSAEVWATGVDGCRSGWFYFALRGRKYHYGVVPNVDRLLGSARLFVDIPIGLLDSGEVGRLCDGEARKVLGPRRSSVFPAPVRSVLDATGYEDAGKRSIEATGHALSRQAFGLVPKIREVDMLMRSNHSARSMIRESHPEVCFWALAGGRPMAHSKKTDKGFEERMRVLEQAWPLARVAVTSALSSTARAAAVRDDVVDALVLALSASVAPTRLRTFPRYPGKDSAGLTMEIVYPACFDRLLFRARQNCNGEPR